MIETDEKIYRQASATMKQFDMLRDGDRVLIGLSGGKDSLVLTEVLARRQKIYKPRIEVTACHVSVENVPYQSDTAYLAEFCRAQGVRFVHRTTSFEPDRKEGRSPCWLCSWSRRKTLFRTAEELGCNRLALGHHMDDIAETALMNITFTGRFESMPPVIEMERYPLTIIRPLCRIRERQTALMAEERGYHKQVRLCPHEHETNREEAHRLLERMERLNPEAANSIFSALGFRD